MRYLSRCSFLSILILLIFLSCKESTEPIPPIQIDYKIAFVSDRDGNSEIYLMNEDESQVI